MPLPPKRETATQPQTMANKALSMGATRKLQSGATGPDKPRAMPPLGGPAPVSRVAPAPGGMTVDRPAPPIARSTPPVMANAPAPGGMTVGRPAPVSAPMTNGPGMPAPDQNRFSEGGVVKKPKYANASKIKSSGSFKVR